MGLDQVSSGFVGKAGRKSCVLWGLCAAPATGLTGLCLQMPALARAAGEPSGHRPSAPTTPPAACSGARRQSQVLPGERGKIPKQDWATGHSQTPSPALNRSLSKPPSRGGCEGLMPVSVCRRAVWVDHIQPASHLLHQHWLWVWNIHWDIQQPLRNHQHWWKPLLIPE